MVFLRVRRIVICEFYFWSIQTHLELSVRWHCFTCLIPFTGSEPVLSDILQVLRGTGDQYQ